MQRILWKISSFIVLLIIFDILIAQKYDKPTLYLSDSLENNSIEYYDDHDTDVLQEELYQRLKRKIDNHSPDKGNKAPKTQFQFLQNTIKYYPEAVLNGEILAIPYPQGKFPNLKEIRYHIPSDFFTNANPDLALQPEIVLDQGAERSTLTFNRAYTLIFYRAPETDDDALLESIHAIQKIYNLLLPDAQKPDSDKTLLIKGNLIYKGYQPHTIALTSLSQIRLFLDELLMEGSLYFYPSRIEIHKNNIMINGLLYIIKKDILNIYHFADTTVLFTNASTPEYSEFKIKFYPYIKNLHVTNE